MNFFTELEVNLGLFVGPQFLSPYHPCKALSCFLQQELSLCVILHCALCMYSHEHHESDHESTCPQMEARLRMFSNKRRRGVVPAAFQFCEYTIGKHAASDKESNVPVTAMLRQAPCAGTPHSLAALSCVQPNGVHDSTCYLILHCCQFLPSLQCHHCDVMSGFGPISAVVFVTVSTFVFVKHFGIVHGKRAGCMGHCTSYSAYIP